MLGGALEALFEPGALDDHVAVAEAALDAGSAILVPETSDVLLDLGMLGGDNRVVALGEDVQELGTPLCGALDLELDVFECLHACKNARRAPLIPGRRLRRR
jgi:hypothetical protein